MKKKRTALTGPSTLACALFKFCHFHLAVITTVPSFSKGKFLTLVTDSVSERKRALEINSSCLQPQHMELQLRTRSSLFASVFLGDFLHAAALVPRAIKSNEPTVMHMQFVLDALATAMLHAR